MDLLFLLYNYQTAIGVVDQVFAIFIFSCCWYRLQTVVNWNKSYKRLGCADP